MLLGVSQLRVQSYNIILNSPNLPKTLVINHLTVWHTFCYDLTLEEKCSLYMFQLQFFVWSDFFEMDYIESLFTRKSHPSEILLTISAKVMLVREICLTFGILHQTVCDIFRAMGIARVFPSLLRIFSDKLFPFRTIKNIFVSMFM